MRVFLQILASLSLSCSLLILLVSALRPRLREKISRRFQYLLWLFVALRLLLPFSPENNLMNWLFRSAESPAQVGGELPPTEQTLPGQPEGSFPSNPPLSLQFPGYTFASETRQKTEPAEQAPAPSKPPAPWREAAPAALIFLWLAGFLFSAGLRLWAYRRFCRRIAAQLIPPPPQALETLEQARRRLSIRHPVALWASPELDSPLLARLGRPCVLLPAAPLSSAELEAALLHELTHYKRRDLAGKALLQLALCVHWFNPLVYWMVRLAQQDCELACDEDALARLDPDQRLAYGDALLRFSLLSASSPLPAAAAPLSADGRLLKERLEAVAHFRQSGKRAWIRGAAVFALLCCAALYGGVYAGPAVPKAADLASPQSAVTLSQSALFYENNYLFTLSPCPFPEQAGETQRQSGYTLAFAPDCAQWRYDAALVNGVDKTLAGSSIKAALLESAQGPFDENADQLAWRFYEEDFQEAFGAVLPKASDHVILELAWRAYREDRLTYFSLASLELDAASLRQFAQQAMADRKASYLYPLSPLLEEDFRYELADQAAEQSCYGCFMPLFESLAAQSRLSMCRQAREDRDVLRFSMMQSRLTDSQQTLLAWEAYDAYDLEFFSLIVGRFSTQRRQTLLQRAYQDGRTEYFNLLKSR